VLAKLPHQAKDRNLFWSRIQAELHDEATGEADRPLYLAHVLIQARGHAVLGGVAASEDDFSIWHANPKDHLTFGLYVEAGRI
jgi:hypothetical protein